MPEQKGDYEVGFGKPPKVHQFKKGQSGNPRGRPKAGGATGKIIIAPVLEEPVRVRVGTRVKKMQVSEAGVWSLVRQAVKDKKVTAAIDFLTLCEEHDVIAPADRSERRLVVPKDYDYREWLKMLATYGPPPWPGEHNGLPKTQPRRFEPPVPKRLPNPLHKGQPKKKKTEREILCEIAMQQQWVMEEGKRKRRCVLEMVLMVLRAKVAEGHRRARRYFDNLRVKYGIQEIKYGGLLLFEEITEDEWVKMFGGQKPCSATEDEAETG